jgi:hypothetical protein
LLQARIVCSIQREDRHLAATAPDHPAELMTATITAASTLSLPLPDLWGEKKDEASTSGKSERAASDPLPEDWGRVRERVDAAVLLQARIVCSIQREDRHLATKAPDRPAE